MQKIEVCRSSGWLSESSGRGYPNWTSNHCTFTQLSYLNSYRKPAEPIGLRSWNWPNSPFSSQKMAASPTFNSPKITLGPKSTNPGGPHGRWRADFIGDPSHLHGKRQELPHDAESAAPVTCLSSGGHGRARLLFRGCWER